MNSRDLKGTIKSELPSLAAWLADHADGGWHHRPLPVAEYRQWHWGPGYRWSAAGNEAWMQYDRLRMTH